ncbi:MAG: glycosyltransferase family 2 protein [Pseudomonadota bacterium]
MSTVPVSAVIIAANAAETIDACLDSLSRLDEVVVYLNGSNDDTAARCAQYTRVRVHEGPFLGFGPTKQAAVDLARNDWVFSIDSDEQATPELVDAIAALAAGPATTTGDVVRYNRFCGKHVTRGGWGNDRLLRVFHRGHARFNDKPVHEKVEPDTGVDTVLLDGVLWHDAVLRLDQFLKKASTYSEIAAEAKRDRKAPHPFVAFLRSQFAFFRSYVLQLGFLAGWRGLVIAFGRMTGTFFRYAKRYTKSRGLEP